jgi:uncharacterized protein with ParB-like and HNH nuclease domain
MSAPNAPVKVDARTKSVRELLGNVKYDIDVFQRGYRWDTKHVAELLKDLEDRFLNAYDESHDLEQVFHYPHYFLGSIIISQKRGHNYIIDGQQRLTSLTLLLVYLHHLQRENGIPEDHRVEVCNLIFSKKFGKKSFNLDLPERAECLEALYTRQPYDVAEAPESNRNIVTRYNDIVELFPDSLKDHALLHFINWLIENVDLVQITAFSDEEAYIIFETMNDRGLRLNPTEMLKGYLLTNINDPEAQHRANQLWKKRILGLIDLGKEEELDFFKAWLRAKYADTIRPRKRGASNQDFEHLGTSYHKWVRDNQERIGLATTADFEDFVMSHFDQFAKHYTRIGKAKQILVPKLDLVYYNAAVNFTLQDTLLLAPLRVDDHPDTARRKIRLVATYIDIFAARRIVNFRTLRYSSIVYTMFNLMTEIRDLDVPTLVTRLKTKIAEMEEAFDGMKSFYMHQQNRRYVHYLLARMTHYIEAQSGIESSFETYVSRHIKKPFEVEHIWGDKYEQHRDEFETEKEFQEYRNRFGALVLLPRGFNQSLGADTYERKAEHYYAQNLLARSLHSQCYEKNPTFLRYVQESGLPFQPHAEFRRADIDARQELYRQLCERIWSPDRFDHELNR